MLEVGIMLTLARERGTVSGREANQGVWVIVYIDLDSGHTGVYFVENEVVFNYDLHTLVYKFYIQILFFNLYFYFIYLAVPDFSCSTKDL